MSDGLSWQVIHLEESGALHVLATADEIAALRETNPNLCGHPASELRDYRTSIGGSQKKKQCITCGLATSQAVRKEEGKEYPAWDIGLNARWREFCKERRKEIEETLIERTANLEVTGYAYYEDYLRSNEWAKKRSLVLKRDNFVCQSCLEEPATEVHHLTYDQIFQEFIFDLVSVCRKCHSRLHSKKIAAAEAARAKGKA